MRVAHAPTKHRSNASKHNLKGEGLRNVVVAAGGETGEKVAFGIARGQKDDGNRVVLLLAQFFSQLEARHASQHDVKQNQLVVRAQFFQSFFRALCRVSHIAGIFQIALKNLSQVGFIIYHQDSMSVHEKQN